jgi:hypothetical protein
MHRFKAQHARKGSPAMSDYWKVRSEEAVSGQLVTACSGYKVTTGIIDMAYRVHCSGCAALAASQADVAALKVKAEELQAELAAYKKAKAEDDERFMTERDEARRALAVSQGGRDEARDWVRRMHAEQQVLTCAFCGESYPPGTAASGEPALAAHVAVCTKHPLAAATRSLGEARGLLERMKRHRDISDCVCATCEDVAAFLAGAAPPAVPVVPTRE